MAVLTYSDLQNRVLRSLDEAGDTGTTLAITKDYIQSAHDQRVTERPWRFMLWPDVSTFTTTTATKYSLHQEFHRPLYVWNRTTKRYMTEVPWRTMESLGLDFNNDTGAADRYILTSAQPVQAQPSASSTVSIVSTSASDTATTVIIRGVTSNGVTTETLTANGTTTVTSTNSFSTILQVTKTGTWVGRVTVTAGSTTLVTLFSGEYGRKYTQLEMLRTPTAGDVIEYRFYRQPCVLSNANDLPDIPHPFSEITVYDALLLMAGYNTELNPQAVKMWSDRRQQLEIGMEQAFVEGQTVGSEVRYVRYMGDDSSIPIPQINRA